MTELWATLICSSITHIFVVGVGFDGCVKSTAVNAVELGYKTFIVKEGTNASARIKEARTKTLRELDKAGVSIVGLESPMLKAMLRS